jgi:hypothetical protein
MNVAYSDMRSFRCAARAGSLVVADDCDYERKYGKMGPADAYHLLMEEGRLTHLAAMNFTSPTPNAAPAWWPTRRQCVGQYA